MKENSEIEKLYAEERWLKDAIGIAEERVAAACDELADAQTALSELRQQLGRFCI